MSDFQTADIDELLKEKVENETADDKAYEALLKQDHELLSGFPEERERLYWPEPVRKRHLR